jgi:biopolymer transport protein ExbB
LTEAQAKLAELRSNYVFVSKKNEKLTAQLETVQLRSENQGQIFSQLEGMLEQATTSVGATEADSTAKTDLASQLSGVFLAAKKKLISLSQVSEETGDFFLSNGEKVEGEITKVGGIAAYGKAKGFAGALMPAGDGHLKVRPELKIADISKRGLIGAGSLNLFIYEDATKEYKEAKDPTLLETVESGGSIAWIIVFMGLFSLLIVGVRALRLKGLSGVGASTVGRIETHLRNGEIEAAGQIAQKAKGSVGNLLKTAVANFEKSSAQLEDILSEVIGLEQVKIERFGTMILVFASVAPLMGLLGTVTGMISTFDIITQFGTGDPKMLSGGISEALITTELGLIVAIPSLLLGNFLSGWAGNIQNQMENTALKISNIKDSNEVEKG